MKFEENNSISIPNIPKVFVYFLLEGNEVVYVGKTRKGVVRPFTHSEKKFDSTRIILVEEKFLNVAEEFFIAKYNPKYNIDSKSYISLERGKCIIRDITGDKTFSMKEFKQWIFSLNFNIVNDRYVQSCIETVKFWVIFQIMCEENEVELPECLKILKDDI